MSFIPSATFADFYALYPRHVGRRAAQKAWDKEIKAGTDPQVIMQGLRRQLPMLARRDAQFIPHPSTWLNGARWEDQDIAPSQPSPAYQRNADAAHATMHSELFGREEPYGNSHFDGEFQRH